MRVNAVNERELNIDLERKFVPRHQITSDHDDGR